MNDRLESLPDDKRQKIISASLAEFSARGYENASTNGIVKAAEISKGLLFHYFGSKKKLFLFILDHTISRLITKMSEYSTNLEGDFFETMGEYALLKTRVAIEEPEMYRILFDVYLNLPEDIKDELMSRYGKILADQRRNFCMKLDQERLRKGVSAETAANLIMDFLDGYYQRNIDSYKKYTPEDFISHMDEIKEDITRYMNIIKSAVYKESQKN